LRPLSLSDGFDVAVVSRLEVGKSSGQQRRGIVTAVFERFTERAIKSVMLAQREAKALGRREVGTEQLLLGLIAEDRGREGYLGSGVTIERAREAVKSLVDESSSSNLLGPATDVPFSHGSKRVFEAALEHSKKMGHNYIAPEHIAIALLAVDDGGASKVLDKLGVKKGKLQSEAVAKLQGELEKEGRAASSSVAMPQKAAAGASTSKRSSRKEKGALNDFCVDITAQAAEGKIDPVIGRDQEVQRVVQILARRTKNNPILLGEPGVGKTAIAEGLAMRICKGDVPDFLIGKRVMSLDMGLLLAGAKERGELETRVTGLIEETRSAGNVILLIDEVHTLVGSGSVGRGGSAGAGLDIANLLKPALARGELQCIGATTLDEHRKHIEKDKALARRFQPVMVLEPSQEDAVTILMGLRSRYEEHHRCHITSEAVEAAVYLSSRYIADRFLPDKAIDLLDEAGSRARINSFRKRKELQTSILTKSPSEYWQEIRAVQASQETALVTASGGTDSLVQDSSSPSTTDARGAEVDNDDLSVPDNDILDASIVSDDEEFAEGPVVVGPAEIAAVASMWSGIPIEQLTSDEQIKLMNLEKLLQTRVVGQDDAVNAISRAVRRARVGLKDPNRPIAAMLFCGPTGVGKTELTKALAQHYFGSEESMIRLDMSEYMERHTVSKLVGSPPGYVGYGEGGVLTEAVRRRPFTVILMDEIEKAHPDVFNMLLQIFEDGHLTDSQGRKVSFKNVLIVMTSNVGSQQIAKGGSNRIGFTVYNTDEADGGKYSQLKELVMEELKGYFRPELLNRLDEVVVFRSLEKSQVRAIVDIMLEETKTRLLARGLHLEVSEAMVRLICDQGYDRSYGARPLRRAVTALVEDNLSEALLAGEFKDGDTALLDIDETGNPKVIRHEKPDVCEHGLCLPVLKTVTVSE
jgi:ATP-dependent Clp protease ATP-binding subunit ClpC